jgi:hypothetical protein
VVVVVVVGAVVVVVVGAVVVVVGAVVVVVGLGLPPFPWPKAFPWARSVDSSRVVVGLPFSPPGAPQARFWTAPTTVIAANDRMTTKRHLANMKLLPRVLQRVFATICGLL